MLQDLAHKEVDALRILYNNGPKYIIGGSFYERKGGRDIATNGRDIAGPFVYLHTQSAGEF